MYKILYTPSATRALSRIPHKWQIRILRAIDRLTKNPQIGKRLRGELEGAFSLRIWPYRVIYIVKKREVTIIILQIGHRQGVYK